MSQEAVSKLIDLWVNDPSFRAAMQADPEGAVRRTGAELSEEEWAALRAIDWSLSDEDLRARASKAFG